MNDSHKVEFAPPQSANLPEGSMDGGEFDLVCSFERKGNKVCMTKFGETPMPGYEDGDGHQDKYAKPSYKDMASGIAGDTGGYQ